MFIHLENVKIRYTYKYINRVLKPHSIKKFYSPIVLSIPIVDIIKRQIALKYDFIFIMLYLRMSGKTLDVQILELHTVI